ncbi:MAG: DUF4383 domain-containing protein [Chloroflexota bacterium]
MKERSASVAGEVGLARGYIALVGVILVVIGILGFFDNPLVGDPDVKPLFVTGTVHNMIHLATGFLALYIAFALVGRAQAQGVIAFGVLYLVITVLLFLSPNLFGILGPSPGYNVNLPDQLLHLAVGIVSLVVGVLARREATAAASAPVAPAA